MCFDEFLDFKCTASMLMGAGGIAHWVALSLYSSLAKMWVLKLIPYSITMGWYQ